MNLFAFRIANVVQTILLLFCLFAIRVVKIMQINIETSKMFWEFGDIMAFSVIFKCCNLISPD